MLYLDRGQLEGRQGMSKYRVPTERERQILIRNGIDPDGCVVSFASEDAIYILRHKTGDEISVRQGCKNWDSYKG